MTNKVEWTKTKDSNPNFDELVLVYCRIYGIFLATYEEIDGSGFGNWRDMNGNLGILPPIYWMSIPEIPKNYHAKNEQ